jgi:hypothetical protein
MLVQLLSSNIPVLQEQCCWAIGNIAGDSDEFREILLANGVLKPIYSFLLHSYESSKVQLAVEGGPQSLDSSQQEAQQCDDTRAVTACWTISNLVRGSTPAFMLVDTGHRLLSISIFVSKFVNSLYYMRDRSFVVVA